MTASDADSGPAESEWQAAIRQQREQKDQYFGAHPGSPIPEDERDEFEGLSYYPVDPDYRFVVDLDEYDDKATVTVETSTGGDREYLRWGAFHVTIDGEETEVQAYKSEPDDDRLWVPFRDATSGSGSYGAGRYVDLEADTHRLDDGRWVLDFNVAYNPTCAYSDEYACPLPPAENWLDVPIEAGEKAYH